MMATEEKRGNSYHGKGLTGLANLGNTCFINATMQCISHTYTLNDFLNRGNFKNKLNKKVDSLLLVEWDKLRQLMWSENCIIKPAGFLSAIHKVAQVKDRDIFTGYAQNDLPEFLNFILECFHESIKREVIMNIKGNAENGVDELAKKCYKMMKTMYSKEYSEFLNIFYGIHISKVESLESDYNSISPEPFFMLDLPIADEKTLEKCFEKYAKPEILDGDNKILNEKTNKREKAKKSIKFWNLPNILVVTLKRFTNNLRKDQSYVDFPLENLNLSEYVEGYNSKSFVYDLYGICNHSGGTEGGHYTAFVKNANDNWYLFNDTSVSRVSKDNIKTKNAYCFFYRKIIL